jgi:hypothetical protein
MRCLKIEELRQLDRYSQFAYLSGALPEFRALVHYHLRTAPLILRLLLRPEPTLTLDADRVRCRSQSCTPSEPQPVQPWCAHDQRIFETLPRIDFD